MHLLWCPLMSPCLARDRVVSLLLLQVRKRLEQIVDHWRGKGIYDDDTATAMIAAMLTAKPSASIPEPGEKVPRLTGCRACRDLQ